MIELFSNVIEPYDEELFVHFSPITMLLFCVAQNAKSVIFSSSTIGILKTICSTPK